jgi:hypothetical protein
MHTTKNLKGEEEKKNTHHSSQLLAAARIEPQM